MSFGKSTIDCVIFPLQHVPFCILKEKLKLLGIPQHKLKQDVSTRRKSSIDVLQLFLFFGLCLVLLIVKAQDMTGYRMRGRETDMQQRTPKSCWCIKKGNLSLFYRIWKLWRSIDGWMNEWMNEWMNNVSSDMLCVHNWKVNKGSLS